MQDAAATADIPNLASRYLTVRKIAEGGSAIVYLAWDTVDREYRAIKILQAEFAKKPALRSRFEREAQTMAQLKHPNIIPVYETVDKDGKAYLVMEYAEGGSVIDWLERNHRPMPAKMAANIGLELCSGIAAAHDDGVIHRDIKPQNLLVDRTGHCKVTDFGIAQATADPRMTLTGTVMGTVGYMAPEQHESAKHADERADIYSIAATLYTLAVGEAQHHLFMAEERDYERISVPLAEVIKKGSQFRREARYQSVKEMATALRAALARLPPDPADTPPLIPLDLEVLPAGGPGASRRLPDHLLNSVESVEPIEDHAVRRHELETPSSIIPRHSLTGPIRARSRRPVIRSRKEMVRQERLRQAVGIAIAVVLAGGLLLLIVDMFATFEVSNHQRNLQNADGYLMQEVSRYATLPPTVERAGDSENSARMDDYFVQIKNEVDPAIREGLVQRLLNTMDKSLGTSAMDPVTNPGAAASVREAHGEVAKKLKGYQDRRNELRAFESTLRGKLTCSTFSIGTCWR